MTSEGQDLAEQEQMAAATAIADLNLPSLMMQPPPVAANPIIERLKAELAEASFQNMLKDEQIKMLLDERNMMAQRLAEVETDLARFRAQVVQKEADEAAAEETNPEAEGTPDVTPNGRKPRAHRS